MGLANITPTTVTLDSKIAEINTLIEELNSKITALDSELDTVSANANKIEVKKFTSLNQLVSDWASWSKVTITLIPWDDTSSPGGNTAIAFSFGWICYAISAAGVYRLFSGDSSPYWSKLA